MEQGYADRRTTPRAEVALACMLHRRKGSPVACETRDVGSGGMSVASQRPLAPDEVLEFALAGDLHGHARVLRQQSHHVYALRFEGLMPPVRAGLDELVARLSV